MVSENDIIDTLSIYASVIIYSFFAWTYTLFLVSLGKIQTLSLVKIRNHSFLESVPTVLTLSQSFEWPKNGYRLFILSAMWGVASGFTGIF